MMVSEAEKMRFEMIVAGQAAQFGLTPEEYLQKVWYHGEAAKIGEFMAQTFLQELLILIRPTNG